MQLMFNVITKGGSGTIILLIEALLQLFNIEVGEGAVASAVNGLLTFVGLALTIWSQATRQDTVGFVFRKK